MGAMFKGAIVAIVTVPITFLSILLLRTIHPSLFGDNGAEGTDLFAMIAGSPGTLKARMNEPSVLQTSMQFCVWYARQRVVPERSANWKMLLKTSCMAFCGWIDSTGRPAESKQVRIPAAPLPWLATQSLPALSNSMSKTGPGASKSCSGRNPAESRWMRRPAKSATATTPPRAATGPGPVARGVG